MDRVIIVSTDSHAGLPAKDYEPYFEAKYRDSIAQLCEDEKGYQEILRVMGDPFPDEVLELIDDRNAIRSGGREGFFDPARRLQVIEEEGIAAEILGPGGSPGITPFFESMCSRSSLELRAAGGRAHNRFLADFCQAAPGRLVGIALVEPWPDMDAAVAEIKRARDAGCGAVMPSPFAGLDGELPGFLDPFWDPFWAVCADLGMPINIHAGFGVAQGTCMDFVLDSMHRAESEARDMMEAMANFAGEIFDFQFPARRPMWQLMWGGVFDRFPDLKIMFTEIHADWVPETLEYLDRRHAQGGTPLKLKPSEYWERNCAAACSSLRRVEVERRHEIGLKNLMFGTDYPHMEGTWPNTLDWLRVTFAGVPEREARMILGENAIDFYGLDRAQLTEAAERVGPWAEDVLVDEHHVNPHLIEHFHTRSGYNKRSKFSELELASAVDEDERQAALAGRS